MYGAKKPLSKPMRREPQNARRGWQEYLVGLGGVTMPGRVYFKSTQGDDDDGPHVHSYYGSESESFSDVVMSLHRWSRPAASTVRRTMPQVTQTKSRVGRRNRSARASQRHWSGSRRSKTAREATSSWYDFMDRLCKCGHTSKVQTKLLQSV